MTVTSIYFVRRSSAVEHMGQYCGPCRTVCTKSCRFPLHSLHVLHMLDRNTNPSIAIARPTLRTNNVPVVGGPPNEQILNSRSQSLPLNLWRSGGRDVDWC